MAPVVLGIELNGYTIYKVTMKNGDYNNPKFMTFIPGSESKINGDNGKDYWTFNARFAQNTADTSFWKGTITNNVSSQKFESLQRTEVLSLKLHELYDPNWDKHDEPDMGLRSWWEDLGNEEYKKSQLKF